MCKQSQLDEHVKGNVLSAFYWGYGVSQVSYQPVPLSPSQGQHLLLQPATVMSYL
jgi:hypothetical protein